jgi:hypothetical protein
MTYVKPGEADGEANGETDTEAEGDATSDQPAEETMVEIDGEEVPLAEAVERNREAIDNPTDRGIVTGPAFDALAKRIGDLEEEIDELYGMDGQQQQLINDLREVVEKIAESMTGVGGVEWEHFDESDGESE